MKQSSKIILFSIITCFLVACSEKDKTYYLSHLDKAEEKMAECRSGMEKAFLERDENKYKKLEKDQECMAAKQAVLEDREIQREKKRLAKEAAAKAAIDEARKKFDAEFGQLSWAEFAQQYVNTECAKGWIAQDNYSCLALQQLYQEKVEQGKAVLLKLPLEQLLAEKKTYCTRDQRKYSTCDIWQQSVDEQGKITFAEIPFPELSKQREKYCDYNSPLRAACSSWERVNREKEKAIIEQYVKDYDSLKRDYNQCIERLAKVGNNYKRYKERNAISDYYPCPQARDARSNLGLPYDNFETPME